MCLKKKLFNLRKINTEDNNQGKGINELKCIQRFQCHTFCMSYASKTERGTEGYHDHKGGSSVQAKLFI